MEGRDGLVRAAADDVSRTHAHSVSNLRKCWLPAAAAALQESLRRILRVCAGVVVVGRFEFVVLGHDTKRRPCISNRLQLFVKGHRPPALRVQRGSSGRSMEKHRSPTSVFIQRNKGLSSD